jgi:hypothetical protein
LPTIGPAAAELHTETDIQKQHQRSAPQSALCPPRSEEPRQEKQPQSDLCSGNQSPIPNLQTARMNNQQIDLAVSNPEIQRRYLI